MAPAQGPLAGRFLIIDDDAALRETVVAQLRCAHCDTIAVETWEEGLAAFRRDPAINVVLLDHPTVSNGIESIVATLWAIRPGTTIVGNSGFDRRADFAVAGVTRYLQKPWRLADLFALLPATALTCGARCYAVPDDTAPPELRPDAVPASDDP